MKPELRAMSAAHKRQAFVLEYTSNGFDPRAAAVAAGYAAKSAHVRGSELLRRPEIAAAIDERLVARGKARELDAEQVLTDLRRLVDMCMTPIPVRDDDGQIIGFKPASSSGAARGLELLGKHLGLYVDRHEIAQEQEIQLVLSRPGRMQPWTTGEGDDEDDDDGEGSVAAVWRSESAAPGPRLVDSGASVHELEAAVEADGEVCSASAPSGRESTEPDAIETGRSMYGIVIP